MTENEPITSTADALIAAALRGEALAWPSTGNHREAAIVERAAFHGVLPLLHRATTDTILPPSIAEQLRAGALAWAAWEERHAAILREAIEALSAAGIEALIFKGSCLAYDLYPSPHLRPRADSDLLVQPRQRKEAARVLESLGLARSGNVQCEHISYEASFVRTEAGLVHLIDLHWRVHYSHAQSRRVSWHMLRASAQPLPHISPHALGTSRVHGLLLACLHRANDLRLPQWGPEGARLGSERLIALYDIHLLLRHLCTAELTEFARLANETGASSICGEAIRLALHLFEPCLPDWAPRLLGALQTRGRADRIAQYQRSSVITQRLMDLASIGGVRAKLAYLREHLTPPESYMRERYPDTERPVIALRMRRLFDGVRRRTFTAGGRLARR